MIKKRSSLLLFFVLISGLTFTSTVKAQDQTVVKDIMDRLAPELPDDFDLSELWDQLSYYAKHPINLNQTTPQELKKLMILSPLQVSNFFSHVAKNGALIDISELQAIDAFDAQTIENILPFVRVKTISGYKKISYKNLIHSGDSELILRYAQTLEAQKGYQDLPGSRYLGSPEKLLLKYRYHYDDLLSVSALLKKDAGEELFTGSNQYRFDFTSFSIGFYKLGKFSKVIIGDYSLQFGQGLTLWSGFSFGKGADVAAVAKSDVGLKSYSSSNESSFFRGLAATAELVKHLNLTTFISYRDLDASQTSVDSGQFVQVNISSSGLHRTKTELKNHNSLNQLLYGTAIQYQTNNLNAGVVAYQSHYDSPFITGNQLYNAMGFTGKELTNVGMHYNYTFRNVYLFGEFAKSLSSGIAVINGAMASLSPKLSAVLVNRKYDKNHHNFFSSGMGENAEAANESGWYAGLNYSPHLKWNTSVYADLFKFPWLKYRVNGPTSGMELMSQVTYKPSKTFRANARFKWKANQQNTDLPVDVKYLDQVNKQNYRIEVEWRLNRKFNMQHRIEVNQYRKGMATPEMGFLAFQDLDYSPLSSRFSANIRLAYFNTDSYNSRVYAYENDVLYGFSFGMYNGKGARSFLNVKYKLLRKMDVWARYAIFLYQDAETVGSGLDEIQGNRKSELKLQLRYRF